MNIINVSNKVVGTEEIQTVNARDLHGYLGVGKEFAHWIKDRIEAYDFKDGTDYLLARIGNKLPSGTNYITGKGLAHFQKKFSL